jgi:hypothetical protein
MRIIKFLFILLLISGCGFRPLYYTKEGRDVLVGIHYDRIADHIKNPRATFFLNNEIERMLERKDGTPERYLLKITYDVDIDDYLIQDDSVASRKKIQIIMQYEVTELNGKRVVASGKLMDFDSFAITESPYADYVSEEDLTTRILLSLVQELKMQLISKVASSNLKYNHTQ